MSGWEIVTNVRPSWADVWKNTPRQTLPDYRCRCGQPLDQIVEIAETAVRRYVLRGKRYDVDDVQAADEEFIAYQCGHCGLTLTDAQQNWFQEQTEEEAEADPGIIALLTERAQQAESARLQLPLALEEGIGEDP